MNSDIASARTTQPRNDGKRLDFRKIKAKCPKGEGLPKNNQYPNTNDQITNNNYFPMYRGFLFSQNESMSRLTNEPPMKTNYAFHFSKFLDGNEQGLEFFYKLWYHRYYYWGLKYIKDDVNADCIVNEAFLRLWLARTQMKTVEQLEKFVSKLIADGCRAFYSTASHKFQRSMLRLDEIDNYQDWMEGFDPRIEREEEGLYEQDPEEELKKQWAQVERVIPNLNADQQLFVRLCIKYSFDYGRISWHVGGISDYQVARKVEKTLTYLKAIITDTRKLETVATTGSFKFEGDVCEEQSTILRMRYELQYSFEEIARELNLSQGYIQKAFVNAMTKIKKVKS